MRKTSSSLPDSYTRLSGSFFIDTSSSGRAGSHPVTLPRFLKHSCSCWAWLLLVPRSKVRTACTRKAITDWRSLVVLQALPVSAEIWGRRASMLALMLDAGALGAVVITILHFLLWRTPIGSASLLLHFVSSWVMILCSLGSVGVMSCWLLVEIIRSLFSLG